jgi:hypothetical protein
MIVGSILDSNGAALTFGLVTAVAVVCLIVATAVAGETRVVDDDAMVVEDLVQRLVADGAEEAAVRSLVREASRLGRRGPVTRPKK